MAVADSAWLIVSSQLLVVPVHAPDQPVNDCPSAGVAVKVTTALRGKSALQLAVQLSPAGCDCTAPVPTMSRVSL